MVNSLASPSHFIRCPDDFLEESKLSDWGRLLNGKFKTLHGHSNRNTTKAATISSPQAECTSMLRSTIVPFKSASPSHINRQTDFTEQESRLSDRGCPQNGKYSTSSSLRAQSNAVSISSQSTGDPLTYDSAISSPESQQWKLAMSEELANLNANETWDLVDLPKGQKAIRCKWGFKTKYHQDGTIDKYKARLVVKGCSQRPGIDYEVVYATVVKYSSIRLSDVTRSRK